MINALLSVGVAGAHVSDPCLLVVSQEAKRFKQCLQNQHQDHCREQRQALTDQVRRCRELAFTNEAIEEAIDAGESQVAGEDAYYLPETPASNAVAAVDVSKGNIQNFRHQFSNVTAFPIEDLDYGAGQGGCQNAFLAAPERYQFLGHFEFKRYLPEQELKPKPHSLFFFARMSEGVCYAAPKPGQRMDNGDLMVLNLPVGFFDFLRQATRQAGAEAVIVRCISEAECTGKKRKAVSLQVDYHATYLRLKRLQLCEKEEAGNRWYRRMAKFKVEKERLPDYCMEETLEENIRQLKAMLRQTGEALFEKL
ncbi:MAG: hypothetical protein R3208_14480 [Ketobacteraceae bacterium]|nr:hypothetical protein [Ketobacteraceae bacterium]